MADLEIAQIIFLLFWQGRKGTLGESAHPGGVSAPRGSQRTLGESVKGSIFSSKIQFLRQKLNFCVKSSIFASKI